MADLTPKQKNALLWIDSYIKREGIAPSRQEIADGLGLKSKSSAQRLLYALAEKGYLNVNPNRARQITILKT